MIKDSIVSKNAKEDLLETIFHPFSQFRSLRDHIRIRKYLPELDFHIHRLESMVIILKINLYLLNI